MYNIDYLNIKNKLISKIILNINKEVIKQDCNLIRLCEGKISIVDYVCLYVLYCQKQYKTYKHFYYFDLKENRYIKNIPNYQNFLRNLRKLKPFIENLIIHQIKQNRILFNLENNKNKKVFLDSTKIEISKPTWNSKIGNKKCFVFDEEVEKQSIGYTSTGKFIG